MRALIMVDFIRGLCRVENDGDPLSDAVRERNVLKVAGSCLATARAAGLKVVHVRLAFDPAHLNRTNRTSRFNVYEETGRFSRGSAEVEFCDEVLPVEGELVLDKGSVSIFASTPLIALLAAQGIAQIYLAGVATHLAIESAAREAADRGFAVGVIEEACAGPGSAHQYSVNSTLPLFSSVLSAAEFRLAVAR